MKSVRNVKETLDGKKVVPGSFSEFWKRDPLLTIINVHTLTTMEAHQMSSMT